MNGVMSSKKLRLVVLCPHFSPDMAPTGVVMTRIVHEMAALGHELRKPSGAQSHVFIHFPERQNKISCAEHLDLCCSVQL